MYTHTPVCGYVLIVFIFKYMLGASLRWFPWDTMVNIYSAIPAVRRLRQTFPMLRF